MPLYSVWNPSVSFLLRLRQVERRAVGFREAADEDVRRQAAARTRTAFPSSPCAPTMSTMLKVPDIRMTLTSVSVTATFVVK